MAFVVHEFPIPTPSAGSQRASKTILLPQGAVALGVVHSNGQALLVVRGDTAQPNVNRTFVALAGDVPLTAPEQVATYVGSFKGYVVDAQKGPEVYHLLAL